MVVLRAWKDWVAKQEAATITLSSLVVKIFMKTNFGMKIRKLSKTLI